MADEEQGGLPIEELGIDLVVNSSDNFISDMSKAGRQMTTFSGQIESLTTALPALNEAFVALKTNLADINNRTGNVKNLAQALNQLGKMPTTVKNVATNAENAAKAVDKLYTSLENAQTRMRKLRTEETKMRLDMQRKQGAPSGTTSTLAVTGKGTASTKGEATPAELAQLRRQTLNAAVNANGKVMQLARKITDDPRNQELAVKLGVEIDEGKISAETEQALQTAIKTAANEAQGPDKRYFEKLGKYVGGGLAEGIAASEEAVIKGGTDMAEHLLAAIANTLQTHSPSKVTNQRGKDVGEGLAQGVKSAIPVVEAAGKAMGDALLGAIDESLGQVGQKAAGRIAEAVSGKGKVPVWATARVERAQAAAQRKQAAAERARSQQIIDQNLEGANYLMSLPDDKRQALKEASRLRVTRKLASNRGQNMLYQGAVEDSLIGQMKVAGAYGTAPGTESLGNTKMQGAFVPSLGRVMRWKTRRGGGASQGHNAGQRDFTGALYQQMMGAYADQGGLENALATAKPDTPEWQALYKNYSPVTAAFPWQPQPARVPRGFKGKEEDLQAAAEAAGKYVIKAMGLDDQPDTIKYKRLGTQKGTAAFNKFFDEMPEMAPFREIDTRDAKQYLREQMRVGMEKKRVADKQGDPQIEQITSEYYKTAHELIGRQDATLDEIIDGLGKVNDQIRKDLRAKFETTGNEAFKMLSERDDPVMRRTIDYLKKFGDQPSKENPGQTMREVIDAWANVWKLLKKKFGGQGEAEQALSEYEHYVSQIETPAARNDLMPNFPRGLEVRRTRGRPRPVDRKLADKRKLEAADAERAYAESQQIQRSRIQMAVDFGDVQGSRKLITQFEKQKMQAQVPDAAAMGVDREKVLEASNAAVSIEWELKAQEDAINQAAEAYAKKNGRTLEQVNQAVENVRTGKNKKPGRALTDLAKMIAEYDKAITRWEAAIDAYLEKALPAQQAASKSIGKGIARGELRTAGAKYLDASGKAVNPEGIGIDPRPGANAGYVAPFSPSRFERAPNYSDVRTRNLKFMPGGLVRGADGRPEVFDTSRTKREYQPEMLGATAEAAYAPAYKKPRGYRAPELTDKERLKRANRAADIQAELGGQWHKGLGQKYGGFKPPTKKAFAGGDLEKAARTFGEYSRDFNELLRIKTAELGIDVKTALDSINTAANSYIGSAIKYVDSFKASGFLEKGAAEKFNAEMIKAQAEIINLKNKSAAGEEIDPATVKTVVKALHERIKTMGMLMEQSTKGLDELEKAADKVVADAAAAAEDDALRDRFSGMSASAKAARDEAAIGDRFAGKAAAGATQQAAQAAGAAAAGAAAAKQTAGTFTFPDDWVIRLVNAIGQAADKVVAAVRGIRIELVGGGVAENVGPTGAQKKAGRKPQTEAEGLQGLANTQADLIRTSEVDAYRAAHTAMRQVRAANDLNPTEVERLQEAIDAWRTAAIRSATDSIKMQANRGDVVDAFRSSRSQSDLDLQKIVGPEIRKTIKNQEKAVGTREMRSLTTAFNDIARAERATVTALQKSGAPAAQLEKDMKAISAAAELAREDVIGFSQSAESFQILDAQIDGVVNSFREMGEQAKFTANQVSRTPLMQKQLAVRTRADSVTRDAERLKAQARDLAGKGVAPGEIQHIIDGIDKAAADATHGLATLLNEARKGGVGAGNSMAAFNLELQKIRASASQDIDVLRRLIALTKQNAPAKPKQLDPDRGMSDVQRAIGAAGRAFQKPADLGKKLLDTPYANQNVVKSLLIELANIKVKTQEAIDKALADTANLGGSDRANAVREAIGSTKTELDGVEERLRAIAKTAAGVVPNFQKIDHAAHDMANRLADIAASARSHIGSSFSSSLAGDLTKTEAKKQAQLSPVIAGMEQQLASMHARARLAAQAGDKAAVNQLVWEIRKMTDAAEKVVNDATARITARADAIDRQVKGIQQLKDWAKDPQSFLQERTIAGAKKDGLSGWLNRARINFQEADAAAEMFRNVQKAKLEMNNLDVIMRTLKNTIGGVFYGISGVFKLLSSPVWLPLKAGIAIFKGLGLAIDGVAGSFKKLRYMVALPGMKKDFAAGLNKDERGQQYADTYAQYTTLFEKMNRTQYSKATAGKKFFAMPGFDKASIDRQAKDFGALQSAYDKLQKAAVKQGLMAKPLSAVGAAANVATAPVRVLTDVLTLGASKGAREAKRLNAELAATGDEAQQAAYEVKRSGLFGRKATIQPKTAAQTRSTDGRYAPSLGFNDIMSPASQGNVKRGMKKLFADMGTGVGLGFGMSFSMGIINSIQSMGWRIQSTIGGIIANGMAALIETEMRKMTVQSFISQEMMEAAGPDANFGDIWTDAEVAANDYYKQIVDIAKVSSFSRTPLLDLFNNMQVGGLTAENAAAVTRAATMFGDAFMPGQKQMLDTFGQQTMQMLSQGVAQQMDLKLMAQQGIPVYDMLAKNLPQYQGMDKDKAQGQIFEDLGKGQISATEAIEAITKGMVDAAANMKGKVASTFSGLMSTFQDLMLEKSEAVMQPVAENLIKPFIEFANDFLQSNPVTGAIEMFGKQINGLSQTIMTGVATALGTLYGLWNALPAPIQETIKAIATAVAIMGSLVSVLAAVAAVGALLAPMFGIITTGMLVATGAIGAFIGAWSTNLLGFRDWLSGWANWAYNWAVYLGKSLADGLLTNVGEFSKAGAAAINGFMANFMGNMESIYASVQSFGSNVGAAIGAGLEQIGDWVQAAVDWLWALPQNAWDVVNSVVEAFWEVPKNLEGIGQAMWSWGENVVTMFAQGMQGAVNVVFDALQAIGNMFTEWLEPGSPPKLLPDLTTWGTGAADAYLEGWTKADYGVLNDLSSKLEEAFAIDEGAMNQGEMTAVRTAVADMIDKAIGGVADTSGIMAAIPGWGGRAESVLRLSDAYAQLAVTQHALTVEQEALDAITAQYDARLKPLQSKLESIQNKQEALDLTSQIKEYQNVLDNIYATDQQKQAAGLKMDELKLSQDINNIEMDRDKLTDPINDRIGALAYENILAQDNLDIALERWNVELGMLKAGSKKEGEGGAEGTDAAGKEPKADTAGGGTEKNRQFTQPKLNVPGITGKGTLGAIGSKMQELSDKIKGYFSDMGEKAKPLVDAIGGIGSGITTIKDAIDTGFQSGAFSADKGFAGFLNNVGASLAATATNIDTAKQSIAGFITQVQTAWNTPFGESMAMGPVEEGGFTQDKKDFGGFKQITKDANQQATLVQRAQAVVVVVQENLGKVLDDAKVKITTFATDISTHISAIDWETIKTDFQTGLGGVLGIVTSTVTDIQKKIVEALGIDFGANDSTVDKLDKTTGKITEKAGSVAEGAGKLVAGIVKIVANKLNSYTMTDEQVTAVTAGSIIVIGETIKNLNVGMAEFLRSTEAQELFNAAGKQIGQMVVGLIAGAAFGGIYEALKGEEVMNAQRTAKDAVNEMFVEFLKGLAKGLVDSAAEALGVPPDAIADITDAFGGEQIGTAMEDLAKSIEPLTTMAMGGPTGIFQGAAQLKEAALNTGRDIGRDWARDQRGGPSVYYGNEMEQMRKENQIQQDAIALQSQLALANSQLFNPAPSGFDPAATTASVRDKDRETSKSILDFNFSPLDFSPYMPQVPQGQVVPFTDVSQPAAEATQLGARPFADMPRQTQSYVPPKTEKLPAIQMQTAGLDVGKIYQDQVAAATAAGTTAGANFSKAYSTATTTALSTATTTGKNVFDPVEKGAPESAKMTWSSFLAGLQQAGGSATTTTGAQGIGTDVIGGIVQGAMSAITTSPMLAMLPVMLVKYFQSTLGIQSPSTVFDQMVGQPIGQGIIQGLNTALNGGGQGGMTPQMIMDTMFLGIMNSMSVFSLKMMVGWYNFKSSISSVLEALKNEWMGIFDDTFEEANTKFDEFAASWVEEKVPEFKDALLELATQAKDGFLDIMQEAVDGLQEKIDSMLAILSSEDLLNEFYSRGEDLGESISEGIAAGMTSRSAAGKFADAAESIVDMINDAIAGAAEVESPSKLFAREIGLPISQGIAVGMSGRSAQRYLETSAGNVIEQIVNNFQGTSTAQVVTARYVRQPEENMVSMQGVTREYHMHLNVTPQMAEQVDYNFNLLETMYG